LRVNFNIYRGFLMERRMLLRKIMKMCESNLDVGQAVGMAFITRIGSSCIALRYGTIWFFMDNMAFGTLEELIRKKFLVQN